MRLRDVREVLLESLKNLAYKTKEVSPPHSQPKNHEIRGHTSVVAAVRAIGGAGVLLQEVQAVLSIGELTRAADPIVVSGQTLSAFSSAVQALKVKASLLVQALDSVLTEQEQAEVNVMVPPGINDLQGLAKFAAKLEKTLDQLVVNDYVNGKVELRGFDRGSEWFEVYLGSVAAVHMLGKLLRLVFSIQDQRRQNELMIETVRSSKIRNDTLEALAKDLERRLEEDKRLGIEEIMGESGVSREANELLGRVKFAFDSFKTLLAEGMQVLPSRTAPGDVQQVFAEVKALQQGKKSLVAGKAISDTAGT